MITIVRNSLLASLLLLGTDWRLPQTTEVRESGPRTYRFTVDYTSMNMIGEVIHRQQVVGDYTRGLPAGEVAWTHVTHASAAGATSALPPGEPRAFMDGFRYTGSGPNRADVLAADFFAGFPPDAVVERNLVWDTVMFESFGQEQFPHLALNRPYHVTPDQDVRMPGVGTFRNRDIELTWIGNSRRNGRDCAVIDYTALMNPFELSNAGLTMKARSHYWGQIWVSLATRQIEYATLQEVVTGELTLPGATSAQPLNVLRRGVFEPVGG